MNGRPPASSKLPVTEQIGRLRVPGTCERMGGTTFAEVWPTNLPSQWGRWPRRPVQFSGGC